MTVQTSKVGEYIVAGQEGAPVVSMAGEYLIEGTEKRVIIAKAVEYLVEGPPPIIPPAPRRRPLQMQ